MPPVNPCHTCGKAMAKALVALGMLSHPTCDPVPQDIDLTTPPPPEIPISTPVFTPVSPKAPGVPAPQVAKAIKDELTSMLLWSEASRPRSTQANIGPSELGTGCDRRLAYRVMGVGKDGPNLHQIDPWPAFVGSAIHTRAEDAFERYMKAHPHAPKWMIENWVQVDPLIRGRADLFRDGILVDLKSGGKDVMDKVRKLEIPRRYRVQQMLYAKGLRDAGHLIEHICLVFVPRSGFLKDMFVWAEPYDEAMALEAIARPYRLAGELAAMDVVNHPRRWNDVPAAPSWEECTYCPMWDKYVPGELGATDKSCPGYQSGMK